MSFLSKMIIGICGQIGSGKSYVASKISRAYNFPCFSADIIAKDAYKIKKIKEKVGKSFKCLENNEINFKILKENLNAKNIKKLNKLIHPYVKKQIKLIKKENKDKIVIIEVPLLFEAKMEKLFDFVICVISDEDTRLANLYKRDNSNYSFLLSLDKYHYNNKKLMSKSDFILYNNIEESKLNNNIKEIINQIKR